MRSRSSVCGVWLFLGRAGGGGWGDPYLSKLWPRLCGRVNGGDRTRGGGASWLDALFFFLIGPVGGVAYCCGIDGSGGACGSDREAGREGDGEGVLNVRSVIDPELLVLCRPPLPRPRAEADTGPGEACLCAIRFV